MIVLEAVAIVMLYVGSLVLVVIIVMVGVGSLEFWLR